MVKLDVNDRLVEYLVAEVAPLVSLHTGWDLKLEGLTVRVLPKDRGYEEIVLSRMQGAGLHSMGDLAPRGLIERMLEYVIEDNVLSAYEPSTQELLMVRENVDDSNLDGLKVVVGHELVHRGQHVNHPEVFARIDGMMCSAMAALMAERPEIDKAMELLNGTTKIMTTIESHAVFVQGILQQQYYPGARIESHFNLATILFRMFAPQKVAQYTAGLPGIASAASTGTVDQLYTTF